jgi:hypothetical protein
MHRLSQWLLIATFIISLTSLSAQSKASAHTPKVFFTGEYESQYDVMVKDYSQMLFTVCAQDMNRAFDLWTDLLRDLEAHAASQNIDLKGVKLWINVFWNKDGMIDHIVFYPKPNSKNLNYETLKPVFESFIAIYQTPFKHTAKYSHYGSANFPVMSKAFIGNPK